MEPAGGFLPAEGAGAAVSSVVTSQIVALGKGRFVLETGTAGQKGVMLRTGSGKHADHTEESHPGKEPDERRPLRSADPLGQHHGPL